MKFIILAGGTGSCLWPLSRKEYAKQFLKLGCTSLFQDTVFRCQEISGISGIFIVTNESQKFLVSGQLEEIGSNIPKENVLIEPVRKNTLPAICFGVREIDKRYGRSTVGVFSSDHIMDTEMIAGAQELSHDHLVTFSVAPDSLHTGWLKHRLLNHGKVGLEIVEVQLGEYVGEDDIVRFDDEYGRGG